MSREVTGNALADEVEETRRASRAVVLRRAAVGAVLVLAAGWALVRIAGVGSDHLALPDGSPAPVASAATSAVDLQGTLVGRDVQGLDRLVGDLELRNAGPQTVRLVDVAVFGLGTVLVSGTAGDPRALDPGAVLTLPMSVIPDCTARLTPSVRIVATVNDGSGVQTVSVNTAASQAELLAVLDPVCPPEAKVALAVAISGVQADGHGEIDVRLVNHGRVHTDVVPLAAPDASPLRLVLDPKAPVALAPGQVVVVRLRIDAPGCAVPPSRAAADALSLEARTPYGFTQVTGWPVDAVARLIDSVAAQCGVHHET